MAEDHPVPQGIRMRTRLADDADEFRVDLGSGGVVEPSRWEGTTMSTIYGTSGSGASASTRPHLSGRTGSGSSRWSAGMPQEGVPLGLVQDAGRSPKYIRAINDPAGKHGHHNEHLAKRCHVVLSVSPRSNAGIMPICWKRSRRLSSSQCSANSPFS